MVALNPTINQAGFKMNIVSIKYITLQDLAAEYYEADLKAAFIDASGRASPAYDSDLPHYIPIVDFLDDVDEIKDHDGDYKLWERMCEHSWKLKIKYDDVYVLLKNDCE
jgi:hypothetical protein